MNGRHAAASIGSAGGSEKGIRSSVERLSSDRQSLQKQKLAGAKTHGRRWERAAARPLLKPSTLTHRTHREQTSDSSTKQVRLLTLGCSGARAGRSVAREAVHRHSGPTNPKKLSWAPYATGNGAGIVFFKAF